MIVLDVELEAHQELENWFSQQVLGVLEKRSTKDDIVSFKLLI